MKKYYIKNNYGFANTYTLVYTETPEQDEQALACGYERITRKEAERLCARENDRRTFDSSFSGFASNVILPIWYPVMDRDWRNDHRMALNGYIVDTKRPG